MLDKDITEMNVEELTELKENLLNYLMVGENSFKSEEQEIWECEKEWEDIRDNRYWK